MQHRPSLAAEAGVVALPVESSYREGRGDGVREVRLAQRLIIIDEADFCPLTAHSIDLLCDRHRGIGSDGILLLCAVSRAVPGAVACMRIFNPDGSEPEMCGNGVRQFARYLQGRGLVAGSEFTVEDGLPAPSGRVFW